MSAAAPGSGEAIERWLSRRTRRHRTAVIGFEDWRGLATRCDKHAVVHRGGLVLAAVRLFSDPGDTS